MEEDIQRLEEIIQNVKSNGRDLELWVHSNELPNDIKEEIISTLQKNRPVPAFFSQRFYEPL